MHAGIEGFTQPEELPKGILQRGADTLKRRGKDTEDPAKSVVEKGDLGLPKPEEVIPKVTKLEDIEPPKPPKLPPAVPQDSGSVGGALQDAGQQVSAPAASAPRFRMRLLCVVGRAQLWLPGQGAGQPGRSSPWSTGDVCMARLRPGQAHAREAETAWTAAAVVVLIPVSGGCGLAPLHA